MKKLKTIDLFAGAGGLSLGFLKTGCFDIKVAVEYDKDAAKTYAENHKGVDLLMEDASRISFKDKIEGKYGKIDVVIGGPPCQGFSNANRQKTRLISGNNQLVQHYVRAIQELDPIAFVLENVKTLGSSKKYYFVDSHNMRDIHEYRIPTKEEKIIVCSGYEPVSLISGALSCLEQLEKYRMCEKGLNALCTLFRYSKSDKRAYDYFNRQQKRVKQLIDEWDNLHSSFWDEHWEEFFKNSKNVIEGFFNKSISYDLYYHNIKALIEVERSIEHLIELSNNGINYQVSKSDNSIVVITNIFSIKDYLEYKFKAMGYAINMAILNAANFGVPQTRERFIMIGIKKDIIGTDRVKLPLSILEEKDFNTVRDAIEDLEFMEPYTNIDTPAIRHAKKGTSRLAKLLCNNDLIYNHVVTNTSDIAKRRFKALEQGQNFHHLDISLKDTYAVPERTQNTIYLRLHYDRPSGTVINVRKSMWIHPTIDRALSIREAARLQTFPDSFIFYGGKNSQYQQVGNAVPPLLGQAIAECLLEQLGYKPESSLRRDLGINENDDKFN